MYWCVPMQGIDGHTHDHKQTKCLQKLFWDIGHLVTTSVQVNVGKLIELCCTCIICLLLMLSVCNYLTVICTVFVIMP